MPSSQAKILKLAEHPFGYVVEAAFQVLMRGGIVALPTDTIYGVSTILKHSEKLYHLKSRPQNKPLGLFVSSSEEIPKYADLSVSPELTRSLLPGPVTLIFNRTASLPSFFNPGVKKVGIRVPDTDLVQAICELLGEPLAQTSANVSGSAFNPMKVADFEELHSEIDLIIDGGAIAKESAPGSTIVDLSHSGSYKIVRDGCARENTENLLHEFGLVPSSNI